MPAPVEIVALVQKFEDNQADYKADSYNETQLRTDFLDTLFAALGWDIRNEGNASEAARDVVLEYPDKSSGKNKKPDYCFRIGGKNKFYAEAKKPSVNIRDDSKPAIQTRSYGWNARLPFCVLSDFEELSIYDCRAEPDARDGAPVARHKYFTYEQYEEKWDEIAALFSRQAVLSGALETEAAKQKRKGAVTVDAAFLSLIEEWRLVLAQNIARSNPDISARDLNFAVQQTIDRIIFLRIAEDRDMEAWGRLQKLTSSTNVYQQLGEMFLQADDRYNSGLFHFSPNKNGADTSDTLSLGLKIPDGPLKSFIAKLYYPYPYNFRLMPVEMLGQVYEQFLGKVIRLDGPGSAKVEDKPEVKKAGGVYYTPSYIVDAIVRQTVGALCEGKTPDQVKSLKILDPACGSGSFLLGAYSFLLGWHLDWYASHEPEKLAKKRGAPILSAPPAPGDQKPRYRLSTHEKKRILLDNIFGVDIDRQAVEVTKLSLLLKVLEDENSQSLQLQLLQERALPDLESNIKCGNSLIESDFYDQQGLKLSEEEEERVNVFSWSKGFPAVMKAGGFDAVIGNPPYIRIQALREWAPREADHYSRRYKSASQGNYDIYVVFVERALGLLNKGGRLGYILPHKFFNAKYGAPVREMLARGRHVSEVVHFGDAQVFANATTYTCLLFAGKDESKAINITRVKSIPEWRQNGQDVTGQVNAVSLSGSEWNLTVGSGAALFDKLAAMPSKLGDVAELFVGLQTSADTVFLFKEAPPTTSATVKVYSKQLEQTVEIETGLLKPVVRSGSIGRYRAHATAQVLFPYELVGGKHLLISEPKMKKQFPKTWDYLCANKKLLSEREHGKFKDTGWYQLYPKNLNVWQQTKIMVPYMITELSAFYDEQGAYFVNVTTGGFGITVAEQFGSMKYVTGLLNSKLLDLFIKSVSTNFRGGYFAANKQFLVQLPIRTIDFSDKKDVARHDRMVELVEQMLKLQREVSQEKNPASRTQLERRIESTDERIDALVFELYDLGPEEIALVKAS